LSYDHNIYLNRFNNTKQYVYSTGIAMIKFVIKYSSRRKIMARMQPYYVLRIMKQDAIWGSVNLVHGFFFSIFL